MSKFFYTLEKLLQNLLKISHVTHEKVAQRFINSRKNGTNSTNAWAIFSWVTSKFFNMTQYFLKILCENKKKLQNHFFLHFEKTQKTIINLNSEIT